MIQGIGHVVLDARGEDVRFPRRGGDGKALQFIQCGDDGLLAFRSFSHSVPGKEEAHVVCGGDGFDLAAQ